MIRILWVLFPALLAFAVARALAYRATLSFRTLGTYITVGVLSGPIAWQVVQGLVNSYGSYQVYHWPFVALGVLVLLLAPTAAFLFLGGTHRVTSVGDVFLLAYMTGFGYDLFTALAGATATPNVANSISYFPPFAFVRPGWIAAGFGYWSGFVALAIAAALRFLRTRRAVQLVGALATFWVVAEISSLLAAMQGTVSFLIRFGLPMPTLMAIFSKITLHGVLTPWLSLLALVALSAWEDRWVSQLGTTVRTEGVLTQWSTMLSALIAGNFNEFQRLDRLLRLRRQLELGKAELSYSPSDASLMHLCDELVRQMQLAEANHAETGATVSPRLVLSSWPTHQRLQLALLIAFFTIVLILPVVPWIQNFFWHLSLFNAPLPLLSVSLLSCALIFIIGWRYLSAARAPDFSADVDDTLQFHGEDTVLQVALGTIFLALLYGNAEQLYSLRGMPQFMNVLTTPNYAHGPLTTIMLLTAATATGLTVNRSDRFKQEPMEIRRATAIARAFSLLVFLIGTEATLVFFERGLVFLHARMGSLLFYVFGHNGNPAGDTIVGLITIGFSFLLFRGLFSISERAEDFLAPSGPAPSAMAESEIRT